MKASLWLSRGELVEATEILCLVDKRRRFLLACGGFGDGEAELLEEVEAVKLEVMLENKLGAFGFCIEVEAVGDAAECASISC